MLRRRLIAQTFPPSLHFGVARRSAKRGGRASGKMDYSRVNSPQRRRWTQRETPAFSFVSFVSIVVSEASNVSLFHTLLRPAAVSRRPEGLHYMNGDCSQALRDSRFAARWCGVSSPRPQRSLRGQGKRGVVSDDAMFDDQSVLSVTRRSTRSSARFL